MSHRGADNRQTRLARLVAMLQNIRRRPSETPEARAKRMAQVLKKKGMLYPANHK